MLLQLEVIVSSNIQRKKPWPRIEWVGSQKESVFLLDQRRASKLYLPSGRTQRILSSLKQYSGRIICVNTSLSGEYVVGILQTGLLFTWHKDTNKIVNVPAYPGFVTSSGQDSSMTKVFVSDDGTTILLCFDRSNVYVWEKTGIAVQKKKTFALPGSNKGGGVENGQWTSVNLGGATFNTGLSKEATLDAVFFTNQIQGRCCICSFVRNDGENLSVGTLLLRWNDVLCSPHSVPFSSSFHVSNHPLAEFHPPCQPVRVKGAYVIRWSRDGETLAIAVNQRQPSQTRILFIHPHSDSVISVGIGRLGSVTSSVLAKLAKTYWIANITWMCDNLFLACITRRGSVLILTRLGEPVTLTTHGMGVDIGPSKIIPLHPLVEFDEPKKGLKKDKEQHYHTPQNNLESEDISIQSSLATERVWKQKYSIAAHPRLPVLLCSDGYSLTALRTADKVRPYDLATIGLAESVQKLNKIVQNHHLQVDLTKPLRFLLPQEASQVMAFKEHRWTLVLKSIKSRLSGNKKSRLTHSRPLSEVNQNVSSSRNQEAEKRNPGILKKANDIDEKSSFTYMFEEYVEEMDENQDANNGNTSVGDEYSLDVDSPLGTKDFENSSKGQAGVIMGADEGKISFGDFNSVTLLPGRELDKNEDDNRSFCGAALLKQLRICRSSLLSALALILTTQSQYSQKNRLDNKPERDDKENFTGDEMFSFFLSTLKFYCKILLELQDVADILLWDPSENEEDAHLLSCKVAMAAGYKINPLKTNTTLRDIICDAVSSLGHCILVLMSWDTVSHSKTPLISEVIDEMIATVLCCRRVAPEGCLSLEDMIENTFRAFILLVKSEKQLHGIYRFGADNEDPKPLFLQQSWRRFLEHLKFLLDSDADEFKSALHFIASYSQRKAKDMLTGVRATVKDGPDELTRMKAFVSSYNLEKALHFAHMILNKHFSNIPSWKVEGWCCVEMIASVMVLYFVDFPLMIPSERACVSSHSTVTSAVIPARHPDGKFKASPEHKIGLERDVVAKVLRFSPVAELWNLNHTMFLLLSCGRVSEAVQVTSLVCDWRTSVILSAVCEKIRFASKKNHVPLHGDFITSSMEGFVSMDSTKSVKNTKLKNMLQQRFREIFASTWKVPSVENIFNLSDSIDVNYNEIHVELASECLTDLYTVALMTGLDLVSWSLCQLLGTTKSDCRSKLAPLVAPVFYLPAPLVYLPQLIENANKIIVADVRLDGHTEVRAEVKLRNEVSIFIRSFMTILNSCKATHLIAAWYVRWLERESNRLIDLQADAKGYGTSPSTTLKGAKTLMEDAKFQEKFMHNGLVRDIELDYRHRRAEDGDEIYVVVSAFREVCSLLWLLHVRDKLCLALRKFKLAREELHSTDPTWIMPDLGAEAQIGTSEFDQVSSLQRAVVVLVEQCFVWLDHLRPFVTFLQAEIVVQELVLSLANNLPMSVDTVNLVAKYFHDESLVSSKVDARFKLFKQRMREVGVPVRKGDYDSETDEDQSSDFPGEFTMKPLSVYFQEECKKLQRVSEEKKSKCSQKPMFMTYEMAADRNNVGSPRSVSFQESMGQMNEESEDSSSPSYKVTRSTGKNLISALSNFYSFESDPFYHAHVLEFLSIMLDKASSSFSPSSKRFRKRKTGQVPPINFPLLLSYRNEVATMELEKVSLQKNRETSKSIVSASLMKDRSYTQMLPPSSSSTPKVNAKKSLYSKVGVPSEIPIREETSQKFQASDRTSLRKYFSESPIHEYSSRRPIGIPEIPPIDLEKLPEDLCKRLVRLTPFFSWLERWNKRSVPLPQERRKVDSTTNIRVTLTAEQLKHGFTISELRFGKRKKPKQKDLTPVEGTMTTLTEVSTILEEENPHGEFDGELVSPDKSDLAISAAVKSQMLNSDEETVKEAEDNEPVQHKQDAIDVNEVQEEENTTIQPSTGLKNSGTSNGEKEDEEHPPLTTEQLQASTSPALKQRADGLPMDVVPDLAASEVASSGLPSDIMADGGGMMRTRKTSAASKSKKASTGDIGTVVRDEIQNVLLAQQVSLLSQILLGQTLGGSQTNPGVVNPLQMLQNMISRQSQQNAASQIPDPHLASSQEDHSLPDFRYHHGPIPVEKSSPIRMMNQKFGIPLFHVSGITKSQDCKKTHLVQTPVSKRAWMASEESKSRNSGMQAPPPPSFAKLLMFDKCDPNAETIPKIRERPVVSGFSHPGPRRQHVCGHDAYFQVQNRELPPPKNHNIDEYEIKDDAVHSEYEKPEHPPVTSGRTQQNVPERPPHFPILRMPDISQRSYLYEERQPGPSEHVIYKTKYPILNSPQRNGYQGPTKFPPDIPDTSFPKQPAVKSTQSQWNSNMHYGGFIGVPSHGIQYGAHPRLIDPREVLAYENSKRAKIGQGFQTIKNRDLRPGSSHPSIPILKVSAPLFDASDPVPNSRDPEKKRVDFVEQAEHISDSSVKPSSADVSLKDEDFDGHVSQDDVNQEFENAAALHYLASVGKQQMETKPRTKDSGQQTETKEDIIMDVEPESNSSRTSKHLPPPDIFLKLRFAKDSGIPLENVLDAPDDDMSKRFINVGNLDAKSVLDGIKQQQDQREAERQSAAQLHYDATQLSRHDHVPGYLGHTEEWQSADSMIKKHIKDTSKVSAVRETTKKRWSAAMQQMSAQLDAIDEMSHDMQQDFRSTERLVETIDALSDAIVPTSNQSQRARKRSLSPVHERSREQSPYSTSSKTMSSPRNDVRNYVDVTPYHPDPYTRNAPEPYHSPNIPQASSELNIFRSRVNEALRLADENPAHSSGTDEVFSGSLRPPSARGSLEDLSVHSSQRRSVSPPSKHSSQDLNYSLQEELNNLLEDVAPDDARIKPWKDRTDEDKRSIRQWMAAKRKERSKKYKEEVKSLRETEKRPFQPPRDKKLKTTLRRSPHEKREIESSNVDARIENALTLLEDMQSDRPNLPTEEDFSGKRIQSIKGQKASQRKLFTSQAKASTPYHGPFTKSEVIGRTYKANTYRRKQQHLPISTSRRHLITAAGIPSEKSPRSPRSVPYVEQLKRQKQKYGSTSQSTHKDVYRKPGHKPRTYDHLMPSSRKPFTVSAVAESDKSIYAKDGNNPVSQSGSDRLSDISDLSMWSMSDEVKALLYNTDSARKTSKGVTFDLGNKGYGRGNVDDFVPHNSVNLADLGIRLDVTGDDRLSQNTESLLADVDWGDVERLVASVDSGLS